MTEAKIYSLNARRQEPREAVQALDTEPTSVVEAIASEGAMAITALFAIAKLTDLGNAEQVAAARQTLREVSIELNDLRDRLR